jgi:hypothetical protein
MTGRISRQGTHESEPNSAKVTRSPASPAAIGGGAEEAPPAAEANENVPASGDSLPAAARRNRQQRGHHDNQHTRRAARTARDDEVVQTLPRHRQADLAVVIRLVISAFDGTLPLMTSVPSMARAGVFMTP